MRKFAALFVALAIAATLFGVLGVSADDRRYVTLVCEEVEHHAG